MNICGDHGAAFLLFSKYNSELSPEWFPRPFRRKPDVLGYCLKRLAFGDAFSGMYNKRRVSTVLWLDDHHENLKWDKSGLVKVGALCKSRGSRPDVSETLNQALLEPVIKEQFLSGERAMTKVVRHTNLTVHFLPVPSTPNSSENPESTTCPANSVRTDSSKLIYHVIAIGAEESYLSKFFHERFTGQCTRKEAEEFCKLMKALDDDSFVVKCRSPTLTSLGDKIFLCEELEVIVKSILDRKKVVNSQKVLNAIYV